MRKNDPKKKHKDAKKMKMDAGMITISNYLASLSKQTAPFLSD